MNLTALIPLLKTCKGCEWGQSHLLGPLILIHPKPNQQMKNLIVDQGNMQPKIPRVFGYVLDIPKGR